MSAVRLAGQPTARARVAQKRRETLAALSLPDLMHDHAHRLLEDIEDAHDLAALAVAEARADGFVVGLSATRQAYAAELDCLRRLFLSVGSDCRMRGFEEASR